MTRFNLAYHLRWLPFAIGGRAPETLTEHKARVFGATGLTPPTRTQRANRKHLRLSRLRRVDSKSGAA